MRIAVAMSGGVDSSLVAVHYKKLGYDVLGVTAALFSQNNASCVSDHIIDARRIAKEYGFSHEVLHLEEDFSRDIIGYFCSEYLKGRTPSPCIICNTRIKMGRLLDFARANGCSRIATGHYARVSCTGSGRLCISRGIDRKKDQSYFLCMLSQEMLEYALFPLGEYHKDAIRKMARNEGLSVAEKEESQDICFIPDGKYAEFVEERAERIPPSGDILDSSGRVLGRHSGIHRYTIGQRRGLGISAGKAMYVTGIDAERNIIRAGFRDELYSSGLFADNVSYMSESSLDGREAYVKTRSTQEAFRAVLREGDNGVYADFDESQPGVTPGQAAVFYDKNGNIMGGAWIERTL